MVFNWHASLRMPGSEAHFSLAPPCSPKHSHTHKAPALMSLPFYTSHRLTPQECLASAAHVDTESTYGPSSGLHRALSHKDYAQCAHICLVCKTSTKGTHPRPWQGLFGQSLVAPSVSTTDSHLPEVVTSSLFFSLPGALCSVPWLPNGPLLWSLGWTNVASAGPLGPAWPHLSLID